MEIQALIFDMDGLLFDSERMVQRSWNITGAAMGYEKMGEHIYNTLGLNLKSRDAYFRRAIGEDFPIQDFFVNNRKTFFKLAEEEGIALKPGAKELLAYAKEHGLKTAVATSSRKDYASWLLRSGGIYDYFDGFIYGDMVTNSKPDPEIFLKACESVGVKPEQALALEDSPNGIRAAYAGGLIPVMVPDLVQPTEEIRAMTYRVYESLERVIGLLEGEELASYLTGTHKRACVRHK